MFRYNWKFVCDMSGMVKIRSESNRDLQNTIIFLTAKLRLRCIPPPSEGCMFASAGKPVALVTPVAKNSTVSLYSPRGGDAYEREDLCFSSISHAPGTH
jgi:hypothetical protein